ncbi:YetF domain-containing protein [uncultured Luteimonas sp.]|uniref:DUF421 domain-containing protein n=1 Tax=uncultured Luteimonas sp. TaxID=453144 RepID=UPI0026115E3C|nr:YetF domain-containing protein [uncultured Luteimonas sp.]
MSDLFELSVPRWELVPRGSGVCFVLPVLVRLSGRRTVGEFMPFDLIVVVLPSETVSDSLVGEETSPPGGLIVAAVPIALDWFIAFATARCRRPNRIVEGHPGLVARAGQVYEDVLRCHSISVQEFEAALRLSGSASRDGIRLSVVEPNGHISIVRRGGSSGRWPSPARGSGRGRGLARR